MSFKLLIVITFLLGTLGVSTAYSEESRAVIEEIIVTARKKQESVQDVPIAMTALSKELKDSTIRDLADIEGRPTLFLTTARLAAVVEVPESSFAVLLVARWVKNHSITPLRFLWTAYFLIQIPGGSYRIST